MLRRVALSSLRCASRRASAPSFKALSTLAPACRPVRATVAPRHSSLRTARFSSDAPPPPPNMTEHEFMELADETLHDIQSWLDGIEEMLEESDVMFSVRCGALK